MALFINEKKMVEDNMFQFENKLKSPMSRFLDTTPTFVTYYHINADETTTDEGFKDVASIIGYRSPIRFKKIQSFPLYGMEQIILQLQDTDQGLDTEYTGEAIILQNTIKPLQNDFFMIPCLRDVYMFRVTEISYDNIMPDNFYKISFQLEYIDKTMMDNLEKQANETYTCVLENIGTENKCIIESEYLDKIREIDKMYDDITSTYMTIFYNDKYNCLLADLGCGKKLYDPLQTEFINKHSLLNKKGNFKTTILTDQFNDTRRRIKYEKSVYRFVERRELRLLNNFKYVDYSAMIERESSFSRWYDESIRILDVPSSMPIDATNIFSDEFVMSIKMNGFVDNHYAKLIQSFVRNEEIKISDIPLDLNDELLALDANLEVFFFTPIIMYIIKTVVNSTIQNPPK